VDRRKYISIIAILTVIAFIVSPYRDNNNEAVNVFSSKNASPNGSGLVFIEPESVEVPILMYHFISKSNSNTNKWKITPSDFEADLKYLSENGFNTVFLQDLIDFVTKGTPLPEKPIVISFDDGDSSVHRYAFGLLKKYNMRAVLSVIGRQTEEYSSGNIKVTGYYPNLTWEQLKELQDSGVFEIQNHSYDMHNGNGSAIKSGESMEEYSKRLGSDLTKLNNLIEANLGKTPTVFSYPFGRISSESRQVLKDNGFYASLTCHERVNVITEFDNECLFGLGRILRPRGQSLATTLAKFMDI
jgi:peptidoglycan/xylan/chitin deacetylase (PgdA/CDA1 family)